MVLNGAALEFVSARETVHVRTIGICLSRTFCGVSCGLRLPQHRDVSSDFKRRSTLQEFMARLTTAYRSAALKLGPISVAPVRHRHGIRITNLKVREMAVVSFWVSYFSAMKVSPPLPPSRRDLMRAPPMRTNRLGAWISAYKPLAQRDGHNSVVLAMDHQHRRRDLTGAQI